jgi:hypothetical protein
MRTVYGNVVWLSGETHFISEGNFEKEGRDVVIAIRAAAMHSQTEVHFGRGCST